MITFPPLNLPTPITEAEYAALERTKRNGKQFVFSARIHDDKRVEFTSELPANAQQQRAAALERLNALLREQQLAPVSEWYGQLGFEAALIAVKSAGPFELIVNSRREAATPIGLPDYLWHFHIPILLARTDMFEFRGLDGKHTSVEILGRGVV